MLRRKDELRKNLMKGDLGEFKLPSSDELKKFTTSTRFTHKVHEIGANIIASDKYQESDSSKMIMKQIKANDLKSKEQTQ